jgi:hypothetical protein
MGNRFQTPMAQGWSTGIISMIKVDSEQEIVNEEFSVSDRAGEAHGPARGRALLDPISHSQPATSHQIIIFGCLDLYHTPPDSGARQYTSRT